MREELLLHCDVPTGNARARHDIQNIFSLPERPIFHCLLKDHLSKLYLARLCRDIKMPGVHPANLYI